MKSIRIVTLISYKILPAHLGGEKGIALFYEYLGKEADVLAISTQNNDVAYARNYRMLNILSNSRIRYANIFLVFTLLKYLRAHKATHLITEQPYYGWLAYLVRLLYPVQWVVHSHNMEYMRSLSIGKKWWPLMKIYERWVYRKADQVFFISEDDRKVAQNELNISEEKSHVITYGVEIARLPEDRPACRKKIEALHGILPHEKILLFNGALYHSTNYDTVTVIVEKINPILMLSRLPYKIIICGKGLPAFFNELKEYQDKNIIYAGFVDDIALYFKAADIFLNPIMTGAGIKTKAVEAIAYGCNVVSTELGALGINRIVSKGKLKIVTGNDWKKFAMNVIDEFENKNHTKNVFYKTYYWQSIVKKTASLLQMKNKK